MINHSSTPRKKQTFNDLVDNDTLGLFDGVKPVKKTSSSQSNPALDIFENINDFLDENDKEPQDCDDLDESKLARALNRFRTRDNLKDQVENSDRHSLLNDSDSSLKKKILVADNTSTPEIVDAEPMSLDEIFESGLFDDEASDIFDLSHISASPKKKPEKVAQRKKCKDFEQFASFFEELDAMVKNHEVDIERFKNGSQIRLGDIFIRGGIYCTVVNIGKYRETDSRYDPRLRVIFSNGTESNLLMRSLEKSLYTDPHGKRIIRGPESVYEQFRSLDKVSENDKKTGEIYFLRSLSERPEIIGIPNLIKIGVTADSTQQRIKNAATDKTYLEAPVEILKILPCYNLNAMNLEKMIHDFLHSRRKAITIMSPGGGTYKATEWFDVPLHTAINVVGKIMSGNIANYQISDNGDLVIK